MLITAWFVDQFLRNNYPPSDVVGNCCCAFFFSFHAAKHSISVRFQTLRCHVGMPQVLSTANAIQQVSTSDQNPIKLAVWSILADNSIGRQLFVRVPSYELWIICFHFGRKACWRQIRLSRSKSANRRRLALNFHGLVLFCSVKFWSKSIG